MPHNITQIQCESCGGTSHIFDTDAEPGSRLKHACCQGSIIKAWHVVMHQETCQLMPMEKYDWGATAARLPKWKDMPEPACCFPLTWRDVWLHMRNFGCTDEEIRPFIIRHFSDIEHEITKLMDRHASELRVAVAKIASENFSIENGHGADPS